jgi:uncharacterized protein YyaL (SSP411 family)
MTVSGWCRRINNLLRISLLVCLFSGLLSGCDEASVEVAREEQAADIRTSIRAELLSDQPAQAPKSGSINLQASASDLIAYLQLLAWKLPDPSLTRRIDDLRSRYLQLLDPVWGGVYLSIINGDSDRPLDPRKGLSAQAAALMVFAAAYQATTEQRYANALSSVDEYLQEWLAVSDGSYFAGQLPQPENLPPHVSVQRYWTLRTEHERRRFGIPGVDSAVPTAANAQLISGYAQAFAATGEANYLRVAIRAARKLLESRRAPGGWFTDQEIGSDSAKPSLETQGLMGLALLGLYQTSADPQWLDVATLSAQYIVSQSDWPDVGVGAVVAAEFLHRLSRLHGDPAWADSGRDLLRGVIGQSLPLADTPQLARLGYVLETFDTGYLELVISGEADAPLTRQLHAAALAAYQPGKLVMLDRADRFPAAADSALHVCTVDGCLPSISDPVELRAVLYSLDPAYQSP